MLLSWRIGRLSLKKRYLYLHQLFKGYTSGPNGGSYLRVEDQASIYVHWPYCSMLCSYCNFNKYVSENVDEDRMLKCLMRETETLLQTSGVKQINSVFFGGGTPSLMNPSLIGCLLDSISRNAYLPINTEVSLEINPTAMEMSKLRDFRVNGINRASIGVQALNNEDLIMLGREHSVDDSIRCVEEAKKLFPGKVSIDLIFGRPKQSLDSWINEIQQALGFCDNHVSLYQLTVERGTKLFKWVQQAKVNLPENEEMADLYRTAIEVLEDAGYNQYEVANFAKQGSESEHNQYYWKGMQYIGVGPGAHGCFIPLGLSRKLREARVQTLDPRGWMIEVEKMGHATRKIHTQTKLEQLEELILAAMRMTKGLENELWNQHCDTHSLMTIFQGNPDVQHLVDLNLLQVDERGMRATRNGIMVLDSIIPYLVDALNRFKLQLDASSS